LSPRTHPDQLPPRDGGRYHTDGKPRSILRIDEHEGIYGPSSRRSFSSPAKIPTRCATYVPIRMGQRVTGMRIMNGLQREGLNYEGG